MRVSSATLRLCRNPVRGAKVAGERADDDETFLTETELVARYRGRISAGTLRNWRSQGRGPPYVKVGRTVLYPHAALKTWELTNTLAGGCAPGPSGAPLRS
jgi:hypothetical protein